MAQKSKRELELDYGFKFKCIDLLSQLILVGIPWGALVFIVYWVTGALAELSGKTTLAQLGISFFGNFTINTTIAYIVGIGGIGFGLTEKRLRRNAIERLQGRIQQLEEVRDPKRTSSKLTKRGTTRPEDKL